MLSTSQAAVKAKWNSFTYPVLPGTPLGANGAVANTSSAVGIVMERIDKKPDNPDEELSIMAGGIVDKAELEYGLSAAAVKALNGIVFRGYDVDPLPAVTAADNGKVLGVVDGAWTKVAGGGGGDVLVVPVTMTIVDDAPVLSTSVVVADVIAATESGKAVLYTMYFAMNGLYSVITSYEIADGSVGFTFSNSTVVHDADGIHFEDATH